MGKLLALLLGGGVAIGITIMVTRASAEEPKPGDIVLNGSFSLEVA